MRIRKKKWVAPYLDQEGHYLIRNELPETGEYKKVYLELGMGMGDFICESAQINRDILYIGYEKEEVCVARSIMKFKEAGLTNVYVIHDDVKELLKYFDKVVDRIYLQFSDPWPKKGHAKRRMTYKTFLDIYDHVLKDDGEIFFKTDNSAFFDFSIMSFSEHGYRLVDFSTDRHRIPNDDILTAYEKKFVSNGQPIYYAVLKKSNSSIIQS